MDLSRYLNRSFILSALKGTALAFSLTTSVSLTLFAYQRILEPIYGSVPTKYNLFSVVFSAGSLGILVPITRVGNAVLALGLLLCAAPSAAYYVAIYTARLGRPVSGPLLTHLAVLAPMVYMAMCARISLESPSRRSPILESPSTTFFALTGCISLVSNSSLFNKVPYLPSLSDTTILHTLGCVGISVWALSRPVRDFSATSSSRKHESKSSPKPESKAKPASSSRKDILKQPALFLPFLPVILSFIRPPILPRPLPEPYTHPSYPLRILSSVQSNTGMIVVGEALPPSDRFPDEDRLHSIRYLRAAHSLLGGVWIGSKAAFKGPSPIVARDQEGTVLGDSIYSAFVLQEAVRLVENGNERKRQDNALIIGLGTGVAASAFVQHNISTTIIEIDPAVYTAARQYFGLPDMGEDKVFLEDARGWVKRKQTAKTIKASDGEQKELYDIVIHDCFSGGGVPAQMFTVEFWEDLKGIMEPDGLVAVNFAGMLGSRPFQAIFHTLQHSFTQCRAFHDSINLLTEEQMRTEFLNMVFICTPSSKPLAFRRAMESDYLNSYLREHVLSSLPAREVNVSLIAQTGVDGAMSKAKVDNWVLRDKKNKLEEWQQESALHHWKLMREVLPDIYWETY